MTMSWNEVFKVHRLIRATYFEDFKIKSMLFSLNKRRSRHNYKEGNTLYCCFDNRMNSQEMNLIFSSLAVGDVFIVYEKIAPDSWDNSGLHVCSSIKEGTDASNRKSLVVMVEPVTG